MAGHSLILLIFLKLFSLPFLEIEPKNLKGMWIYVGMDSKEETFVECPEVIFFGSDGTYEILNDCYGTDRNHPVIENGKWTLDPNGRMLNLIYRKFKTNYIVYGSSPKLSFEVKELSSGKLILALGKG